MSAKEMFEKLNYLITEHEDSTCYLRSIESLNDHDQIERNDYIVEFIENKEIGRFINTRLEVYIDNYYEIEDEFPIEMDLLQAINQQVKELGWIDEN